MKWLNLFIATGILFVISCKSETEYGILAANSFYSSNGIGSRIIYSRNILLYKTTIYPDVISYSYDDNFIVAKQKPDKESTKSFLGADLYTRYNTYSSYIENPEILSEKGYSKLKGRIEFDSLNYRVFLERGASSLSSSRDIRIREEIADSLINNDPYYRKIFSSTINYWVIDNRNDSLIGPLTKSEYLAKRKELNIPTNVEISE